MEAAGVPETLVSMYQKHGVIFNHIIIILACNNQGYTDLFICGRFNDACRNSGCTASKSTIVNECRIRRDVDESGYDLHTF